VLKLDGQDVRERDTFAREVPPGGQRLGLDHRGWNRWMMMPPRAKYNERRPRMAMMLLVSHGPGCTTGLPINPADRVDWAHETRERR
jgi:hypothetical protein